MNKNISQKLIATAAILAIANIAAFSAAIPVFNTGVNNSGGLLPNSTIDSHYSLIAAPSPYNTAYTGNGSDVVQMPWLQDGPSSRWINPSGWMGEWLPAGNYLYRTTFSLSGLNPGTASLNLKIASDNSCKVFFNGVDTGIITSTTGFTSFAAFNINSGFVAGLNALDFVLNNAVDVSVGNFNPTGLRVELTGTAAVVPEPTSLALIGLGGMMLLGLRRTKVVEHWERTRLACCRWRRAIGIVPLFCGAELSHEVCGATPQTTRQRRMLPKSHCMVPA